MGIWEPEFDISDDLRRRAKKIQLVIFDVDGVLTDGSIRFDEQGNESKSFNTQDGHGIKLVQQAGIKTGIISARQSGAVQHRVTDLGIGHYYSGRHDKLAALAELLKKESLEDEQFAYVGDDWVDIPVMLRAGLAIAVANAHPVVQHIAHWTTPRSGGQGAVRCVCDLLLTAQDLYDDAVAQMMSLKN